MCNRDGCAGSFPGASGGFNTCSLVRQTSYYYCSLKIRGRALSLVIFSPFPFVLVLFCFFFFPSILFSYPFFSRVFCSGLICCIFYSCSFLFSSAFFSRLFSSLTPFSFHFLNLLPSPFPSPTPPWDKKSHAHVPMHVTQRFIPRNCYAVVFFVTTQQTRARYCPCGLVSRTRAVRVSAWGGGA